MTAEHTWIKAGEKAHKVEIMMHVITYYGVHVSLNALENKDIDLNWNITEGITHEFFGSTVNSYRDKVDLTPYDKGIENHPLTFTKQCHKELSQSTASRPS